MSDIEYQQRRPGIRLRFVFGAEELFFAFRELGQERSFAADYAHIFVDSPSHLSIDSSTLGRRVVWAYLAFLVTMVGTAFFWAPPPIAWGGITLLGVAAFLFAILRGTFTLDFILLPVAFDKFGEHGREMQVIDDETGAQVLEEIRNRRIHRLRTLYAFVDIDADPEREAGKFEWLRDNRVIDEAEYQAALEELRGLMSSDRSVH
jgi:hypothetical protein